MSDAGYAWIPDSITMTQDSHWEVVVAGGGPVGLLLANLLGQRGVRTLVVERRATPPAHSMAIGITPPSLAILRRVGLDAACVQAGVPVTRATVHDRRGPLGGVDFGELPAPYPFILCLPQTETVRILEEGLRRYAGVTLLRGVALQGVCADPRAAGRVQAGLGGTDGNLGRVSAAFLAGCDGHASAVRAALRLPVRAKRLGQTFLMADFDDEGGLGAEARLWFTEAGSVESFPLPGGRRRWIVQTAARETSGDVAPLVAAVRARAGVDLAAIRWSGVSPFAVRQFVCRRYWRGRIAVCGDAAHVMSPIGGQGMNTGFGDAALLADTLGAGLRDDAALERGLRRYDRVRRRAFAVAARRATRGMWLGTRTGALASRLRSRFLRDVLLRSPVREKLPPYFAMLTIPGG